MLVAHRSGSRAIGSRCYYILEALAHGSRGAWIAFFCGEADFIQTTISTSRDPSKVHAIPYPVSDACNLGNLGALFHMPISVTAPSRSTQLFPHKSCGGKNTKKPGPLCRVISGNRAAIRLTKPNATAVLSLNTMVHPTTPVFPAYRSNKGLINKQNDCSTAIQEQEKNHSLSLSPRDRSPCFRELGCLAFILG